MCTDVSTTRSENYQNSVTGYKCTHQERVGYYDCNHFDGKGQCWGFARKMAYEYYGVRFGYQPMIKDINKLKPGDIVRYKPGTQEHSIWVTAVNGNQVTYVECNFNGPCMIDWDRITTKTEIAKTLLHIEQAPEVRVELDKSSLSLYKGQSAQLNAVINGGSTEKIKWTSSNNTIATVSSGVITAKGGGGAIIKAVAVNAQGQEIPNSEAECKVIVKKPTLGLSHPNMVLVKGYQKQIIWKVTGPSSRVNWSSSKPSVASVLNGKVIAKSYGNAVITASANGIKRYCTVKVLPSIRLHTSSVTLVQGKSVRLWANVDGPSKIVTWKVGNAKVATVSRNGTVKGKMPGKTTVYASANGKTARCVVTVKAAPDYKTLYKNFLSNSRIVVLNTSIKPSHFCLINIDKKGVPELVVAESLSPRVNYFIYTVRDGAVRYMGDCSLKGMSSHPTISYSSKYKGIYTEGWSNGVGGIWSALHGISGTQLVRKQHAEEYHYPTSKYYIGYTDKDRKQVSRSEYLAFVKKYMGNLQKYTMISNTYSNRNRYLK